jgi:hypothetical protein
MPTASATLVPVVGELIDRATFERAWKGVAQLTINRNTKTDFQDRQVYLFVDGEAWGKVRYGRPLTREIEPGHHSVRAFNTLFSHTIEIDVAAGEHCRLRCSNSMPTAGWLMMIFLHVTALCVKLEREP